MSIRRNAIANYLGQGWAALMQLAFVPVYVRVLGTEAYGLIGFYTLLLAWSALLDLGMSPTLTREAARFAAGQHSAQSLRELLRTLEWTCLAIGALVVLAIGAASGWLAHTWLRADTLPLPVVAHAIMAIGLVVALRFCEGIYRGTLMGLGAQPMANALNALGATLRGAGGAAVLLWLSADIEAFFAWQGLASAATLGLMAWVTHRRLAASTPARFSWAALRAVRGFAGTIALTTLLALLLTQVDKLLLSRLLPLDEFGAYALAATVASALTLLVMPATQALYPRLTELAARRDEASLIALFHRGAQTVTVLCAPAAVLLVFLSEPLLRAWTGDAALAARVAPLLSVLALGTFLNGLVHVPYMLQLAHGWPGLAARMNAIAVLILVPLIAWVTPRHGAIAAAWAWAALNAGYVFLGTPLMYRRLIPGERRGWLLRDIALPAGAAALVGAPCAWLVHRVDGLWPVVAALIACTLLCGAAAALSAPHTRGFLLSALRRTT